MAATHLSMAGMSCNVRGRQVCGSTPFIWAVTMGLYTDAARCPPRSDRQNSRDFRPRAAIIADRGTNRFLSQKCLSEHTLKEKCPKLGPRARRTDGFDFGSRLRFLRLLPATPGLLLQALSTISGRPAPRGKAFRFGSLRKIRLRGLLPLSR